MSPAGLKPSSGHVPAARRRPAPPFIDSHIHLFPGSEVDSLRWCVPGNALRAQHSVADYLSALDHHAPSQPAANVRGYVFVETDRKSSLSPDGWEECFREMDWLRRVGSTAPRSGDQLLEGHSAEQAHLMLAIVAWAPVPAGPELLEHYISTALERAGPVGQKVRGWRYLVQAEPDGTMSAEGFVASLRRLGERGEVFDLALDFHRRGGAQLGEALSMLGRVYEGVRKGERVRVVINHLGKPNMTTSPDENPDPEAAFNTWAQHITKLAGFKDTYMKLSGSFSEIDSLPTLPTDVGATDLSSSPRGREYLKKLEVATQLVYRHLDVAFKEFGPERCMFGSDWPVCNVGGGGKGLAWSSWYGLMESWMESRGLSADDKARLWSGTAEEVYLK